MLPTEDEMLASVEEFYRRMDEARRPKHLTHHLHPFEVLVTVSFEYQNWLVAQLGLPPVEESMEQMYLAAIGNLIFHRDGFRDNWDDNYWINQSNSAVQKRWKAQFLHFIECIEFDGCFGPCSTPLFCDQYAFTDHQQPFYGDQHY
ncbi:hypothetical protein ACLOJK_033388 [Asimina triloba]